MAKIDRECIFCGNRFSVFPCQVKKGNGNFCSISCSTTYRNLNNNPVNIPGVKEKISKNHADVSGNNNPMFGKKGNLAPSYIDGRNKFTGETYRKIMLVIDPNPTCSICDENDLGKLSVHHIDGKRKNNEIDNLVWLCYKCHNTKAHCYIRDDEGKYVTSFIREELEWLKSV